MEASEEPKGRDRSPSLPHVFHLPDDSCLFPELFPAIATWYWNFVQNKERDEKLPEGEEDFSAFDEVLHPIDWASIECFSRDDLPYAKKNLESWILRMEDVGELENEDAALARIFVVRAVSKGFPLSARTMRWLILACFIVASKNTEDSAVHVEDFSDSAPESNVKDMIKTERLLLSLMDHDTFFTATEMWESAFAIMEACAGKKKRNGRRIAMFRRSSSTTESKETARRSKEI